MDPGRLLDLGPNGQSYHKIKKLLIATITGSLRHNLAGVLRGEPRPRRNRGLGNAR